MKLARAAICFAVFALAACAGTPSTPSAQGEPRRGKGLSEDWRVWRPTPGDPTQWGGLPLPAQSAPDRRDR